MKMITAETSPRIRPSMFLHGVTGSGKSTFATTGGRPLVILTEPKAESVLRQINPDAVGLVPESLADLHKLLELLGTPEKTKNVDRIILDSFTGLTEALPAWMRADAKGLSVLAKSMEIQEYGDVGKYALALVEAIQLTGLPSVIIGRSISKKIGRDERISPDSVGKSVDRLPGKLLPTAEARFDPELGYVIDTTPSDYSQRCGLPWVPPIFTGTCLEFLQLVERGSGSTNSPESAAASAPPAATAPANASTDVPGADDPQWVDLMARLAVAGAKALTIEQRTAQLEAFGRMYLEDREAAVTVLSLEVESHERAAAYIDPEKDPKGYQEAFGRICKELQDEKIARGQVKQHRPEVEAFVNEVAAGPNTPAPAPAPDPSASSAEDVQELIDLAARNNLPLEALWRYAVDKGQGKPNGSSPSPNWLSLTPSFISTIKGQVTGPNRSAFIPWLINKYGK